jgi:hypothetical protein
VVQGEVQLERSVVLEELVAQVAQVAQDTAVE